MNYKMLMDIKDLLDNCDLVVREKSMPKGKVIPPHWHNYLELEIITGGRAVQVYNGEKYQLCRGSMYMLSYCDYHSFSATDELSLISIRFKESLLNNSIAKHINIKPNRLIHNYKESEINEIISKIKVLDKETSNPQIYTDIIKSSIISELVVSLIRSSSDTEDENVPQLIQQAVVYVNTNFREKLTLGELAKELSVSVNYLGSLFKKYLKTSFNEYLNNIRLKYACKLLLTSDLTIKEVAFESGYSSVEYFSYTFKKMMHMSPGAYHRDGF